MAENSSETLNDCRLSFHFLRKNGHKVQLNSWLTLYWTTNTKKKIRILWNMSRKIGNAVTRNRLKRRCREFFRIQLKDVLMNHGMDFNLVFKPSTKAFYKDLRNEEINKELSRIEKKIRYVLERSS